MRMILFFSLQLVLGGILVVAKNSLFALQQPVLNANSITVAVSDLRSNTSWTLTGVYSPQNDLDKKMFLRELKRIKESVHSSWVIIGDFNLIYKDQDKSNCRLNRTLMLRFKRVLNQLEVKEVELNGRNDWQEVYLVKSASQPHPYQN
jgi:hypothetical protein